MDTTLFYYLLRGAGDYCNTPVADGVDFCCSGCEAAYAVAGELNIGQSVVAAFAAQQEEGGSGAGGAGVGKWQIDVQRSVAEVW
jgi:hypothetical protein